MKVRVPFSDTDAMGVVHHSRYLIYMEMARIEFMRDRCYSYVDLQDKGFHLPVIDISIRYRRSCRFDDILNVNLKGRMERLRIIFEYEIVLEATGEVAVKSKSEHVLVDQNLKMVEPPQELIKVLFKE